jgi:hypothetical protein
MKELEIGGACSTNESGEIWVHNVGEAEGTVLFGRSVLGTSLILIWIFKKQGIRHLTSLSRTSSTNRCRGLTESFPSVSAAEV